MSDLNNWITFVGHTVVGWDAYLPAPRGDVEPLLQFGIALVEAGRVQIFCDGENLIDSARLVSDALSGSIACG